GYPVYNSFFEPQVVLSFLVLLSIFGFGVYLFYRSREIVKVSKSQGIRVSEYQSFKDSDPVTLRRSDTSLIAFGIFWFFITLSVESSIIPIRDVIFEHRLYLPSTGLIIASCIIVFHFASRLASYASRITHYALRVTYFAVVIVLSIATYQRNSVWQNKISLWQDVVSKSPNNARGHYGLGNAYREKGDINKAIEHYLDTLTLKPDYAKAHNDIGVAYGIKGLTDKAIEHYQIALKLEPNAAITYYNMGLAYLNVALIDKAIEHFHIAIRLKTDYADAHLNLGNIYHFYKGLHDKAIEHYEAALRLDPNNPKIHLNLGIIYREKGWINMSKEHLDMAKRLKPALFKE
ncbi:MAG: tetratricopeptide repeat protein, partial [Nitrospirae bacterium]|nr:tetratricopeptide repeat protein [Nitrospirota bacterium]